MHKTLLTVFSNSSDNLKSKIKNRKLVGLVALAVTFVGLAGGIEAQQQTKVTKIGWLAVSRGIDDYKKALRALGYIEGKNIAFEYRSAEGEPGRFPALADELVRLKVDLIVAYATTAALAAKNATRTIPIVFTSGGDPVAVGLIDSLARPGGNLTGFSNMTSVSWPVNGWSFSRKPFPNSPALRCCETHGM